MLIQPLFCARAFNNHWLDLNYSIIEALEQRRIQHPVRHLPWSFLQKQLKQLTSFSGQHGRTHRSWESTCPPLLPSPVFRKSKIAQKIFFFLSFAPTLLKIKVFAPLPPRVLTLATASDVTYFRKKISNINFWQNHEYASGVCYIYSFQFLPTTNWLYACLEVLSMQLAILQFKFGRFTLSGCNCYFTRKNCLCELEE